MVGEEAGSEGSTSVMAVGEGRGARSLDRESFLFEKEKEENLSEVRALLLWSRGTEEGGVATRTWTSSSCRWLFPTESGKEPVGLGCQRPRCC